MDVASAAAAHAHDERVTTVAAVTTTRPAPLPRRADLEPPLFVGDRSNATTPSEHLGRTTRHDRVGEAHHVDDDLPHAMAEDADADASDDATGEKTSANEDACRARVEGDARLFLPSLPTIGDHVTAEMFMRMVITHQPYASTAHERTAAWNAIARACAEAGSRKISRPEHVTKRLGVLTTALFESPHRLASELRDMVLLFNERNCHVGYGARLRGEFLSTLRSHATFGVAVNNHTDRQVDAPSGSVLRTDRMLIRKAQEDELLMQRVMTFRPFDTSTPRKLAVWNRVAVAFNTALDDIESVRGKLTSGKSAAGRVTAATSAVLSRAEPYNGYLSPSLRATIVEFNLLNLVKETQSRELPTSPASQVGVNRHPRLASDELFMRIVMEKRSIHASFGATVKMWNEIADAFVAAGGEQMHGYSAMARMEIIVATMLHQPCVLTRALRTMIVEYYEHYGEMSVPRGTHTKLLELLRKKFVAANALEKNRPNQDETSQATVTQAAPTTANVNARKKTQNAFSGAAVDARKSDATIGITTAAVQNIDAIAHIHRPDATPSSDHIARQERSGTLLDTDPNEKTQEEAQTIETPMELEWMDDDDDDNDHDSRPPSPSRTTTGETCPETVESIVPVGDESVTCTVGGADASRIEHVSNPIGNSTTARCENKRVEEQGNNALEGRSIDREGIDTDGDESLHLEGSIIDQVTTERFLRIVLEHQPYASTAHERMVAWNAISRACVAAGSRSFSLPEHVTKRLGILTIALFESPHVLPSDLRAMVLCFNECNCSAGYGTRLRGEFLETLRHHATSGAATNGRAELQSGQQRPVSRGERVLQVKAREDELLMEHVMTFRPFDASTDSKMSVWKQVADALNTSLQGVETVRGKVAGGRSAVGRVKAATTAVLNRADPYNAHLSPSLRARIVEFNLLNLVAEKNRALPTPQTPQEKAPDRPRLARDDLFLRIVMEKRSIHASSGATVQMWDQVADAFVAAGGDQMHGYSAMTRMETLVTSMLQQPHALAPALRTMIVEYYRLYGQKSVPPIVYARLLAQLRENLVAANALERNQLHQDETSQATVTQAAGADADVNAREETQGSSSGAEVDACERTATIGVTTTAIQSSEATAHIDMPSATSSHHIVQEQSDMLVDTNPNEKTREEARTIELPVELDWMDEDDDDCDGDRDCDRRRPSRSPTTTRAVSSENDELLVPVGDASINLTVGAHASRSGDTSSCVGMSMTERLENGRFQEQCTNASESSSNDNDGDSCGEGEYDHMNGASTTSPEPVDHPSAESCDAVHDQAPRTLVSKHVSIADTSPAAPDFSAADARQYPASSATVRPVVGQSLVVSSPMSDSGNTSLVSPSFSSAHDSVTSGDRERELLDHVLPSLGGSKRKASPTISPTTMDHNRESQLKKQRVAMQDNLSDSQDDHASSDFESVGMNIATDRDSELPVLRTLVEQLGHERREYRAQHDTLVALLQREREAQRREMKTERKAHRQELKAERKARQQDIREEREAHHREMEAEREAQRRETQSLLDTIDRERQDRRDEFVAMANLIQQSIRLVGEIVDQEEPSSEAP